MAQAIIEDLEWGQITTDSGDVFKDAMLAPGLSQEWDWTIYGVSHKKGPQIGDINVLIERDIDTIILSRGVDSKLCVTSAIYDYCKSKVKNVIVDHTNNAVQIYNGLVKRGNRVGALIHSTC